MDAVIPDIIDTLTEQAKHGADVWDMVIAEAETHVDSESASKFAIGDLALLIEKRYGENRIEQFAKAIRKAVTTVEERRTVCKTFNRRVRADFCSENPNLTYSHFRRALPIEREHGLQQALDFLEQASANDWTVEETTVQRNKLLGKPTPPAHKTWHIPGLRVDQSGQVILALPQGYDAANIGELVAKHSKDNDFDITLTVTYTR